MFQTNQLDRTVRNRQRMERIVMQSASIAFDGFIMALCVYAAVTDWRRGILPDWCNALIAVLGLSASLASGQDGLWRVADAAIVCGLFLLLRVTYRHLRGQSGLGLGDVKFLTAATLRLGLAGLNILILAACVTGLLEVAVRRVRGERVTGRTALRFGVHLAMGFFVALAFERFAGFS